MQLSGRSRGYPFGHIGDARFDGVNIRGPVAVLRDARCALGPTEYGYFGPERVMLTQICANEL